MSKKIHTLNTEDINNNMFIESTIARSSGTIRKSLIVKTNIIKKEVIFIVLDDKEEKEFNSIEDAVSKYNSIGF